MRYQHVSYDAQICPVIAKGQRAPNAQVTCQIVNRHYKKLKSSCPDSQTLKNPFQKGVSLTPFLRLVPHGKRKMC
jgi:hypothetical protein